MSTAHPQTEIAALVWALKYRYRAAAGGDESIEDSWRRVARALAAAEPDTSHIWAGRYYELLSSLRFLPGGRILAGAGTAHRVTLFNCFVMGRVEDSMDGIFEALKEGALTLQQGGGVGYDFSTLRPAGLPAHSSGTIASGPVSFMRIWDSMCATLLSTGARRGAMMATLRCDHPDIERFIDAKRDPRELRHFNLSVLVSDAFMEAVQADAEWPLVFPAEGQAAGGATLARGWPGHEGEVPCAVLARRRARDLWQRIMRAAYDCAEPGVLFIDRINRGNNLQYCEQIVATNPCGEIPLPPYGACNLGSLNLTQFVRRPFSSAASLDLDALAGAAATATRMLDDVIEVSRFPLPQQAAEARGKRRIGLGITGLADALIMLGLHYADRGARGLAAQAMRCICHAAYRASIGLARERAPFEQLDRERYLQGEFPRALPPAIRAGIAEHGIRNSHVTAIAPAGTISLLADNVSGGIEPVHAERYLRHVAQPDGSLRRFELDNFSCRLWRSMAAQSGRPPAFVCASELAPADHLDMQAALQPFVDNAISKTINVPEDLSYDDFSAIYEQAFERGLKGCTVFRPNPITGEVLMSGGGDATVEGARCRPSRSRVHSW